MRRNKTARLKKNIKKLICVGLLVLAAIPTYNHLENSPATEVSTSPEYSGSPYRVVRNNVPDFTQEELNLTDSYEYYSDLDSFGRCQAAEACIGRDLIPTEKRGSISSVHPTGWHFVKYNNVDGKSLFNRCHLIAFYLTDENTNERNLITGPRYMNVQGMLPFENKVADYVKSTGNHVMYRVEPDFEGSNLLASGVYMEAESVEDNGAGIKFNVYCYNVQPGIGIDYATGDSWLEGEESRRVADDYSLSDEVSDLFSNLISFLPDMN